MEYIVDNGPEDLLLDDEVNEIEDAELDLLSDDSSDIDRVGEITDDDIDADEYDPMEDLEDYADEDYDDTYNDDEYIDYVVPDATDDEIIDSVEDEIDDEEDEEDYDYE